MLGFPCFVCSNHMISVLDDFARYGFLTALQVGIAEEIHGMRLIVRFGEVHFSGVRAGSVCGNIRSDGILPKSKAHKDMRRHVQGMGRIRRDGRVPAGSVEALGRELRPIGRVNHVMCHTWMVRMLF